MSLVLKKEREKIKYYEYLQLKKIKRCRESFWFYCKSRYPDFYKNDRIYLNQLCNILQQFHERKLINPNPTVPNIVPT